MIDMQVIPRTHAALAALGAGRGPIVVGPWLSEIGFEVLYWVPFLRWAMRSFNLRREDITIVSRGGARSWYQDIGAQYIDVLDFYTPAELCAAGPRRVEEQIERAEAMGLKHALRSSKQHMITAVDRDILDRVGMGTDRLIHPSLMYAYFRPFWKRKASGLYRNSATVKRLTPPALTHALPASYVAMKFYSSMALPDTLPNRHWVQQTVEAQAQTSDVVLLHQGTQFDDHGEFPIARHPRVHIVNMDPIRNLDQQTAIIAGASRYVGTYGGFCYLAPFLGVPTLGLYGETNFRQDHRDLMASVACHSLKTPFSLQQVDQGPRVVAEVRHAA